MKICNLSYQNLIFTLHSGISLLSGSALSQIFRVCCVALMNPVKSVFLLKSSNSVFLSLKGG